jgi:DNA-binding transcriptional ArsR family regulator
MPASASACYHQATLDVLYKQNVHTTPREEGCTCHGRRRDARMSPRAAAVRDRADRELDLDRRRFMDDLGHLYARFGLSVTFGRAFALLLLSDRPISLEDLAAQLEVSKSAVSVAARELERVGIARRLTSPGSRRVLYEANDDMVPLFQAQFARIRLSLPVFQAGEPLASRGRARQRLRDMVELHEFWLIEAEGIVERWRKRERRASR